MVRRGKEVAKGYPFYNAGQKGLKGSVEEGGVRVPFFVRWKGKVQENKSVQKMAAHIDIFPTFAELAGLKLSEDLKNQVDGRSILPLIENPEADWADRYLFSQNARWKTGSEPNDHMWKAFSVRNQRYRLVGEALFDMEKDPGQKVNIAEEKPALVKKMRAAYETFWKEARPLMVNETAPMSPVRPYHVWYREQVDEGGIPVWKVPQL